LRIVPLWTPTTAPCLTGWLLAAIRGWPLVGVVTDVEQHLACISRDLDGLEHAAGAGALLVDDDRSPRRAVRKTDRVCATLGDCSE
jgi:hypothetical protein